MIQIVEPDQYSKKDCNEVKIVMHLTKSQRQLIEAISETSTDDRGRPIFTINHKFIQLDKKGVFQVKNLNKNSTPINY